VLDSKQLVTRRAISAVPLSSAAAMHLNEVRFDAGGRVWILFNHMSKTSELHRPRPATNTNQTSNSTHQVLVGGSFSS